VLDGLILLVLVTGSRVAFRVFRSLLPAGGPREGRRVLIYGAGDGGELLLRELLNNRGLGCVPVSFADDDPLKKGTVIHGLRVFGGNGTLCSICREQRVQEVVISSTKFTEERVREIVRDCERVRVQVKRMRILIERVDQGTL
jgi:UDP-GlcNAc:undecaprenyl-phosphate GlcNAc-1-phosphate transferase